MVMNTNEKKVALVSGANKGVGFQIARALAENGYVVYVGARDMAKGEAAAAEIGSGARAIQLDITDAGSVAAAVDRVAGVVGYLTLLVHNSGIAQVGKAGTTMGEGLGSQMAS